jgi:hypothetical protein
MNSASVLSNLRSLEVEVTADGDNVRYCGPRGSVTPFLLGQLRIHKREILKALKAEFLEEEQAAVLMRSRRFGCDVWVALSADIAAELLIEEQQRESPRPVLRQSDLKRLDGMSEDLVRAVLNVAAVFPGTKIIQ